MQCSADVMSQINQGNTLNSAQSLNSAHSFSQQSLDGGDSQLAVKMMRGEVSAKTTYQRTANGPVSIGEASAEGKFIMLENSPSAGVRKDMSLDGWRLRRVVDGNTKRAMEYVFHGYVLGPNKAVKVYAKGSANLAGVDDLVNREAESWGAGKEVVTTLLNDRGEEKASHIQKTNYA